MCASVGGSFVVVFMGLVGWFFGCGTAVDSLQLVNGVGQQFRRVRRVPCVEEFADGGSFVQCHADGFLPSILPLVFHGQAFSGRKV